MKVATIASAFCALSLSVCFSQPDPLSSASRQIDDLVLKGLDEKGLKPNAPASDEVFVRRIYLDIMGRIPTKTETLAFLESTGTAKREALIDRLLASDGYVSHHYNFWADLLRARTSINGNNLGAGTGHAYELWIKESLRNNKPYDQLVRELITAEGHSWENGAVGYYIRDYGMPLDNTAMTAQTFLGTQIVCAQCHNHPFDKWTQMDYYHMAAFTYGMLTSNNLPGGQDELRAAIRQFEAKNGKKMSAQKQSELRRAFSEILKPVRFNNVVETSRRPKLPKDYQYDDAKPMSSVEPASIMGPKAVLSPGRRVSESFAEWLTNKDNPRFSLVMANRLWKKAFGLGLIEPVDNLKDYTQASNPDLMNYLDQLFKDLNFDMKAYLAAIYKSEAYQREASLEEVPLGTPYDFPGPILRRMSAEQVWDSMVAMIRENPDAPDSEWNLKAREQILRRQLIGESLYHQSAGQFMRHGWEILKVQSVLSEKIDTSVAKLTAARESGDAKKIAEASREVKEARRELVEKIERQVYLEGLEESLTPAAQKARESQHAKAFFADLTQTLERQGEANLSAAMEAIVDQEGGVVRKLVEAMLAEEKDAFEQQEAAQSLQETKEWKIKKDQKMAYIGFKTIRNNMKRASELPSPAPDGHFLREFGQSDRELIDNASGEASVTQALTMLNGNVPNGIANPFSVFSRAMREGDNFEERLDNVYLTMFSRPASEPEKSIFRDSWKADPEAASISSIVWTLLNTRQFLFIN